MKFSDLNKRIMVAAFGIPVILFLIIAGKWWTVLFTMAVSLGFVIEFHYMLKEKQHRIYLAIMVAAAISWPLIFYTVAESILWGYFWLLLSLIILVAMIFKQDGNAFNTAGYSFFIAVYGILFPSMIIYLREYAASWFTQPYIAGGKTLISWMILIWVCDTAAYFGGTAFGKRKLAPQISPNKSVEGFLFGIAGSTLFSILLVKYNMLFISELQALGLGVVVGLAGQIGDLIESRIKRLIGVKDSSKLLPGHGGIMDRFDSLVFTAPLILIYLSLLKSF